MLGVLALIGKIILAILAIFVALTFIGMTAILIYLVEMEDDYYE